MDLNARVEVKQVNINSSYDLENGPVKAYRPPIYPCKFAEKPLSLNTELVTWDLGRGGKRGGARGVTVWSTYV